MVSGRTWIGIALAASGALGGALAACDGAVTPAPARGGKPARICSLSLVTDELLSALVPTERVAAVTRFADEPQMSNVVGHYPRSIQRMPQAIAERVLALKPDLVCLAFFTDPEAQKLLSQSGLPMFRLSYPASLDDMLALLEELGAMLGESERAAELRAGLEERLDTLARRLAAIEKRPRVFFWGGGWTVGSRTMIGDVIARAGGINLGAELGLEGHGDLSIERVLAADPDVVLTSVSRFDNPQGTEGFPAALQKLRAVREGRVISLPASAVTTVSQFAVDAAEQLAQRLHPGAFAR